VALVQASGMGQVHAAILTKDIALDLAPRLILMVGIAAALGSKVELGDIVCAEQLVDYEIAKDTVMGLDHHFPVYPADPQLLQALKADHEVEWSDRLIQERPASGCTSTPAVHFGSVLCGNKIVANSATTKELLDHFPKALALEMESFGAACALQHMADPPAFGMIKAMCDKGDEGKNDSWQKYAASAAAAYVLSFLQNAGYPAPCPGFRPITEETLDLETAHLIHALGIAEHRIAPFKYQLIRNMVVNTVRSAGGILVDRYSQRLDHGHHFLSPAIHLFGMAQKVCAVSLDMVSTFWLDERNRATAIRYLNNQAADSVSRLFVFSDADNAHKYAIVLDAHAEAYSNVFVCSIDCYVNRIWPLFKGSQSLDDLLKCDYGVLEYRGGEIIYSSLTDQILEYRKVSSDGSEMGEIDYAAMVRVFDEWKSIPRGQLGGPGGEVLRWDKGLWKGHEEWTNLLTKMFSERTPQALHLLLLYGRGIEQDEMVRNLTEIKRQMIHAAANERKSLREKYGIQWIWIGNRPEVHEPKDGLYHGKLNVNEFAPRALVCMHFAEYEKLKGFEEDEGHAQIRKSIYSAIDERVKTLYAIAGMQKRPLAKAAVFEALEGMVSHKILRWDYKSSETIPEMIMTTKPYPFG
jgi:nucleoside phosphorylase